MAQLISSGADSHMHDFDAHVHAVEEDLEYYRAKRFESRLLFMARRGIVTFYDLVRAADGNTQVEEQPSTAGLEMEQRIRALEDRLDAYVKEIAVTSIRGDKADVVTEDNRKERGDYDSFFRLAKREHQGGSLEKRVEQLNAELAEGEMLLRIVQRAMIQRGLSTQTKFEQRRLDQSQPGPWNGARIVARAWVDPGFKHNLIEHGREAVRELDIPPGRLGKLGVAESTDEVHNVVVCTLCSCYPYDLLGDTPWWYKNDSYKQRVVRDPRGTLKDMFGLEIPAGQQIHVHDSTSDIRWMVLPLRPPGTEGLSEDELARLVTRDSLIGTAMPLRPGEAGPTNG